MAAMTDAEYDEARYDAGYVVVPMQRDRRDRRPDAAPVAPPATPAVTVLRIASDAPLGAQVLLPALTGSPSIAGLLPIQRDRRARRARRGSARRMTALAVAFGVSLFMWVAIIGGVLALARTL